MVAPFLVKPATVVIRPFESLHAIFLRSAPIRPQITPPGRRPLSSPSPIPSQPRRLPPTPPSPRDAASRLAAPQIHLPVPASPSRLVSLRHAACVTAAAACGVRDGGCRGTRRTVRARRPARRRTARRPGRSASRRPAPPTPPSPRDPAAAPPPAPWLDLRCTRRPPDSPARRHRRRSQNSASGQLCLPLACRRWSLALRASLVSTAPALRHRRAAGRSSCAHEVA